MRAQYLAALRFAAGAFPGPTILLALLQSTAWFGWRKSRLFDISHGTSKASCVNIKVTHQLALDLVKKLDIGW